jgi:hypothetical protein
MPKLKSFSERPRRCGTVGSRILLIDPLLNRTSHSNELETRSSRVSYELVPPPRVPTSENRSPLNRIGNQPGPEP